MMRSATLILPTSRLQFYFNFESYNEMWSFNILFSYKIIGHIVTEYFVYLNPSLFLGLTKKLDLVNFSLK